MSRFECELVQICDEDEKDEMPIQIIYNNPQCSCSDCVAHTLHWCFDTNTLTNNQKNSVISPMVDEPFGNMFAYSPLTTRLAKVGEQM